MNDARAELPDDVEVLKALVLAQQSLLSERAVEIEHLKLIIAKLKRLQFGRRSEKIDREIEQLELRLEELQVSAVPRDIAQCREVPGANTGAPPAAGASAAHARRARAGVRLPRLRGGDAQDRRGRRRDSRLRAGALPGDPARAPEAGLPGV